MSFPTSTNSQITDSMTQTNTEVVGVSPAMAMGNLYISTSQALSNAAHNATSISQNGAIIGQASTTVGVLTLYGVDVATDSRAIDTIFA
jgi:hypothetical protein